MATATRSAVRSQSRRKFNEGLDTIHIDEIKLGEKLHVACKMIYGKKRCLSMIEKSPASLFRRMRYGRRVLDGVSGNGHDALVLVEDRTEWMHEHKPTDRQILTPFSRRWKEFERNVKRLALMPRWADGWTATAETLDDLGYAIGETIAVLLLYGFESDDCVVMHFNREEDE